MNQVKRRMEAFNSEKKSWLDWFMAELEPEIQSDGSILYYHLNSPICSPVAWYQAYPQQLRLFSSLSKVLLYEIDTKGWYLISKESFMGNTRLDPAETLFSATIKVRQNQHDQILGLSQSRESQLTALRQAFRQACLF